MLTSKLELYLLLSKMSFLFTPFHDTVTSYNEKFLAILLRFDFLR